MAAAAVAAVDTAVAAAAGAAAAVVAAAAAAAADGVRDQGDTTMKPRHSGFQTAVLAVLAGLLLTLAGCSREPEPGTYATPEEAVAALDSLVGTGDAKRADEIFGPGSLDLFQTGDPAEDRREAQLVKQMLAEKVGFEEIDEDTRVALFGEKEWPFPIPLVRKDGRWRFDTAAGREELLNRRIGYYELWTLASLHAYVDAQRDYAAAGRDGKPAAFAQRFLSSEGSHDGLYWPVAGSDALSPLGDLLAGAAMGPTTPPGQPRAFHGYYFRILKGQGEHAPGGARSYLDPKGHMTAGFAAVAWPAKYGNSGIMTFIVNQQGIVFEKDLGEGTDAAVAGIQAFDPDDTWHPTSDSIEAVDGAGEEVDEAAGT
jgi:hypothetical protein